VGQWQNLSLRPSQSDAASVTSPKEFNPCPVALMLPTTGLLCGTALKKMQKTGETNAIAWCIEHEGFVQAIC
jgi:hypothetical protein